MPLFDRYIAVDWSAANTPKTGADSIWIADFSRHGSAPFLENPRTRQEAMTVLVQQLTAAEADRIFLGVDFALGYPTGFAQALNLAPTWHKIWQEIAHLITDTPRNQNNRFDVAREFNQRISRGPSPFWGCPPKARSATLLSKKPLDPSPDQWARHAERHTNGSKPVWQLLGTGCVGSQTLMGIAHMHNLRFASPMRDRLRLWPFETGFDPVSFPAITLAEIYPSQLPLDLGTQGPKDAQQVMAVVKHYARLDAQDAFCPLFGTPPALSAQAADEVTTEEGWILGV